MLIVFAAKYNVTDEDAEQLALLTEKQVEKLRKLYQKEIGDVKSALYKTERVDGKYKLIVTGLTKQQRQKLFTTKALFTQNLKEENEFSRAMQIRAGIIK